MCHCAPSVQDLLACLSSLGSDEPPPCNGVWIPKNVQEEVMLVMTVVC